MAEYLSLPPNPFIMDSQHLSLVELGDIRSIFFISVLLEIVMDPDLQLIHAIVVANHCLPNINGCSLSCDLGF